MYVAYNRTAALPCPSRIHNSAYELRRPASFKIHPVISASRLELAKPDEWQSPRPRVTLKVRNPQSGEVINRIKMSQSIFGLPYKPVKTYD
jgi:hypothetical protein